MGSKFQIDGLVCRARNSEARDIDIVFTVGEGYGNALPFFQNQCKGVRAISLPMCVCGFKISHIPGNRPTFSLCSGTERDTSSDEDAEQHSTEQTHHRVSFPVKPYNGLLSRTKFRVVSGKLEEARVCYQRPGRQCGSVRIVGSAGAMRRQANQDRAHAK